MYPADEQQQWTPKFYIKETGDLCFAVRFISKTTSHT
jgi:hypothetical protein